MPRRILVTRPEPGASETAARLAERGHVPLVLPLTRIAGLAPAPDLPAAAGRADAVVATTSANALRHAPRALLAALAGRRCYAVGAQTAEAAAAAGLRPAGAAAGNAEALAAAVAAGETAGTPVIYLCGRVRTAALERALAAAGLDVGAVETYDTVPVHHTSDHVAHVTGWNPVWGTLVFSAVAAQQFAALRARSALALLFGNTRAFCISQRVAAALDGEMPAQRVAVAERPDEAALLDLLAAHT